MHASPLDPLRESPCDVDRVALAPVIAEAVAVARSAWPTVDVATERFAAHVADRLPDGVDLETAVRDMHTSDLYLACGCLHGDAGAIAALDRDCLTVIDRALPRLGMTADVVSEVKQRLRHALLIGEPGPPRIAGFAGRGDLRRWIRVMAVREALALARRERRHVAAGDDQLVDLIATGASPELEYFKRVYRREFEIAFRAAVDGLSDRDRMLVKQHFLDGLNVIQIARLYHVHRVTAGRWLEQAREALLAATRESLMTRLNIPPDELESILRLVLSRLEISLRPMFRR